MSLLANLRYELVSQIGSDLTYYPCTHMRLELYYQTENKGTMCDTITIYELTRKGHYKKFVKIQIKIL